MKGESVEIVVNARSSDWSWHYNPDNEIFRERLTVPESGIVDFVVPSSKVPQSAKMLSLEVGTFSHYALMKN